jgi:hypothetical protein
LTVR